MSTYIGFAFNVDNNLWTSSNNFILLTRIFQLHAYSLLAYRQHSQREELREHQVAIILSVPQKLQYIYIIHELKPVT